MARGALKPPSVLGALLGDEFADRPKKKVTFVSPEISRSSLTSSSEEDTDSTSNAESTHAEAGTDDELDELDEGILGLVIPEAEDNMATADSSEVPDWTREEDRAIVKMKTEGSTWADIGKELDRGKKEVQRRHKALSSDAEKLGLTVEKLGQIWTEENEGKSEKKGKNKDKVAKGKDNKGKGKGNDKPKAKGEKAKTVKGKDTSKKPAATDSSSSSKNKRNAKGKKKVIIISSSSSSSSSPSDDDDEDSEPEPESDDKEEDGGDDDEDDEEAEHWAQQRHLYHSVYGPLYPDQRPLRPDASWSADDCRTLAVLDARRRALRWMFLQSDFYNATGRMVDAGVLRAKLEEAEAEAEAEGGPGGA